MQIFYYLKMQWFFIQDSKGNVYALAVVIPVQHIHAEAAGADVLSKRLGDGDRAVPAACAADADGDGRLALGDVARQKEIDQGV